MASTNYHTGAGILYEGNFEDWKRRLHAWICVKFHRSGFDLDYDPTFHFLTDAQSRDTVTYICSTTCHSLLDRVPERMKSHWSELFEFLKNLATPFRFLDLPPEIRNSIYELNLPSDHWVVDNVDGLTQETAQYPAVLHVNGQVRKEALSVFYQNTAFYMDFNRQEGKEIFQKELSLAREWSEKVLEENAKHIRRIALCLGYGVEVIIEFSEKGGLSCTATEKDNGELSEESLRLLEEHSNCNEVSRKVNGVVKGRAVVTALLSGWDLWWSLCDNVFDSAWDETYIRRPRLRQENEV